MAKASDRPEGPADEPRAPLPEQTDAPSSWRARGRFPFIPLWPIAVVLAILLALRAGQLLTLPYYSIGPGPAINMLSAIDVEDAATYPSKGQVLLTTASVSSRPLSFWETVAVWLHDDFTTVPADQLRPGGETDEESDAEDVSSMETSKIAAEVAAFRALGRRVRPLPGPQVMSVVRGSPSDGALRQGDRIVAVDGRATPNSKALVRAVQRRPVGSRLRLRIERGGETGEVIVRTRRARDDPRRKIIGVHLGVAYRMPYEITIDSEDVGGPSGGLTFALSVYDALTETDLTRGNVIAATGVITEDGIIGPVGAVAQKARAAKAAHANVFIVPKSEVKEAREAAPPSVYVMGVETLSEAIAKLRALPARAG